MKPDTLLQALQDLLKRFPDGFSIPELQLKLFREFKFQLSYQEIENAFFRRPDLFREEDGRWMVKRPD